MALPQAAPGTPDASVQALIERRRALRLMQQQVMDDDPGDPKDPRTIAAQQAAQAAQGQPVPQPGQPAVPPAVAPSGPTNPLTFEEMYRRRFQQR